MSVSSTVQKVFLSSTNADLVHYRDAVSAAVGSSDHLKCLDYRKWGSQPSTAHQLCREKVVESNLFVSLIGPYRGWELPGDNRKRSITELEFDWAIEAGKPRFICVTPDDFSVSSAIRENDEVFQRQLEFRRRVMVDGAHIVSQDFATPDRLAATVINSLLSHLLAEHMKITASNVDAEIVRDDENGIREALTQLAEDDEADLNALLENPVTINGEELEQRLETHAEALLLAQTRAKTQAAQYYMHIGSLAFLRDTQKAFDAYGKALSLDSNNAEGWRQLGVLHIRRGDFKEARTALQKAQK